MRTDRTGRSRLSEVRQQISRVRSWLRLGNGGLSGRAILGIHLAASTVLILLALRDFLFGSGYIIYHNIVWPITYSPSTPIEAFYSPYLWTATGPDPGGYTRSFADALGVWIGLLTGSSLGMEKAFAVYVFVVEYLLAFVAATLFVWWFPIGGSPRTREAVRVAFVCLIFVNPAALQWEAGWLVPFFWAAPILEIAIFGCLLSLRFGSTRYAVASGLALGFGATLDPRIFFWGWIAVGALYLYALILPRWDWSSALKYAATTLSAVPGVLLTAFAYDWSGESSTALRPATAASLASLSTNSGGLRVFELTGFFITEITYAPPSVYLYSSLGSLNSFGNPTLMLLPPDPVTALWVLALAALPCLAFVSLLFREERKFSLPLSVIALGSILFAAGTQLHLPGLTQAEVALGSVALVGPIWQTVIGVPIYTLILTEAMFVPLVIIGGITIWRRLRTLDSAGSATVIIRLSESTRITFTQLARSTRRRHRRYSTLFAAAVVLVVVFGSWQFMTGSFYPGGYSVGVSPNGVPSIGSASPVTVPVSDSEVAAQFSASAEPYAVYWPGASGFSYEWSPRSTPSLSLDSPKPAIEPPGIAYLVDRNLTADTAALLQQSGARYVVIDNMSSLELMREFGTGSLSQVLNFFNDSPGVRLVEAWPPYTWLYQTVPNATILGADAGELTYFGSAALVGLAEASLAGVGVDPVLVYGDQAGAVPSLSFLGNLTSLPPDATRSAAVIASASNLSALVSPTVVHGFSAPGPAAYENYTSTGETPLPSPFSNWTLSVWSLQSGSVNLSVNASGTLGLTHSGSASTTSVNYLSSLVDGSYRGIPVDASSHVSFDVSAEVSAVSGSTATAWLNVIASNSSAVNVIQENSPEASVGASPQEIQFSGELPLGSAYFTLRLFSTVSGTLDVRNVSISWAAPMSEPSSVDGTAVELGANQTVRLDLPGIRENVTVGAQVLGGGNLTVLSGNLSRALVPTSIGSAWETVGDVSLNGTLTLAASGETLIGALVVVPTALPASSTCRVGPATSAGTNAYAASASMAADCYIVLHEVFSERWLASGIAPAIGPPFQTVFDQPAFKVPSGNGTIRIGFPGSSEFPLYVAFYGGGTLLLSCLVLLVPRARGVGWKSRVRRILARASGKAGLDVEAASGHAEPTPDREPVR